MIRHRLEITVKDAQHHALEKATVTAFPEASGEAARAAYDRRRQLYFFDALRPGFYRLCVEHPKPEKYEQQERRIQVHPKPTRVGFILFPPQSSYTFRGDVRVPYTRQPDLLGVIIARHEVPAKREKLFALFSSLELLVFEVADAPVSSETIPRSIIVQRSHKVGVRSNEDILGLRESPLIEAAGPLFQRNGSSFTVFTSRLLVRFRPEITGRERSEVLESAGLTFIQEMSFAPNLIMAQATNNSDDEQLNEIIKQLLATEKVMYAEPSFAQVPVLDCADPNDFLWDGCWDRQLVRVDRAWQQLCRAFGPSLQFGSENVIIAVIDTGIKSVRGKVQSPDLNGRGPSNIEKIYKLFDFDLMKPHNDCPLQDEGSGSKPSSHGVSCASIAAAMANNSPSGSNTEDMGVVGAAPNAKLIGLIPPATEPDIMEMFVWAAGLQASSVDPRFPCRIRPGANIFTCSMQFGPSGPLSGAAKDMFDHITSRGRNGRGCLAIFSAGNNSHDIEIDRPYGAYERSFACAASTLNKYKDEIRARYSGWGELAWCTPSGSTKDQHVLDPPEFYAVLAADFLDNGNTPSFPVFETELALPAKKHDTVIRVTDVSGLTAQDAILIGDLRRDGFEINRIANISGHEGEVTLQHNLLHDHDPGTPIIKGPRHHKNNFGGTSAATPLSAGICALVLSANPDLTWVEARQILRDTAIKIDPHNNDQIGQWLDKDGEPSRYTHNPPVFSLGFGYGRLDACRAVEEALTYQFTRDLMIRKKLRDTGEIPSRFLLDSPDIWVRNLDLPLIPMPCLAITTNPARTNSRAETRSGGFMPA